jgi:adenylylsulfate kinase-like enzyme
MPATLVQVLMLSGLAGVGTSTPGWEIAAELRRLGIAHVLLDSDELDRAWPLTTTERDTTGRAVPDLARQVIERTGWAGQAAQAQDGPAAAETS